MNATYVVDLEPARIVADTFVSFPLIVQKDLARQHAEKALATLDKHEIPASSWTNTDEYRGEIRRAAEKTLKKVTENQAD